MGQRSSVFPRSFLLNVPIAWTTLTERSRLLKKISAKKEFSQKPFLRTLVVEEIMEELFISGLIETKKKGKRQTLHTSLFLPKQFDFHIDQLASIFMQELFTLNASPGLYIIEMNKMKSRQGKEQRKSANTHTHTHTHTHTVMTSRNHNIHVISWRSSSPFVLQGDPGTLGMSGPRGEQGEKVRWVQPWDLLCQRSKI